MYAPAQKIYITSLYIAAPARPCARSIHYIHVNKKGQGSRLALLLQLTLEIIQRANISTRLFCARLAAVSFELTGELSP